MQEGNLPEKKFKAGSVNCTLWVNRKKEELKTFRTVTLERNYKDKNDNWQSTNSFRINDLPKAMLVLSKAYEYLVLKDKGEM